MLHPAFAAFAPHRSVLPALLLSACAGSSQPATLTGVDPSKPAVIAKTCGIPPYPAESERAGELGTIKLNMLVSAEGVVKQAEVISSTGYPRLDNAALSTLSHCSFVPAMRDGQRVEAWAELKYSWRRTR